MLGQNLRAAVNRRRAQKEHKTQVKTERKWLLELCRMNEMAGKYDVNPGILEEKIPANVKTEKDLTAFLKWCRAEALMACGCRTEKGLSYTFFW